MEAAVQAAPVRTDDQRMDALKKANGVRSRRAQFKRQMKATGRGEKGVAEARADAADLVTTVPGWAATMKALEVLMSIPKVGRVKANRMLNQCRISPSKTLGGMSDRQRAELVGQIRRL
jgi:hypothetical protein